MNQILTTAAMLFKKISSLLMSIRLWVKLLYISQLKWANLSAFKGSMLIVDGYLE